ncbi:MAG: hypothetical protein IKP76_04110, partial [Bacilli bacterium]|nr:hypothetical protein [Bacilli bacterium]
MLYDKATTFRELKLKKSVYNLANYYNITNEELFEIYDYLVANKDRYLVSTKLTIKLYDENNQLYKTYRVTNNVPDFGNTSFDGIRIDDLGEHISTHYVSHSSFGGGGSSSSSGGGSSNNNNNNNNTF